MILVVSVLLSIVCVYLAYGLIFAIHEIKWHTHKPRVVFWLTFLWFMLVWFPIAVIRWFKSGWGG